MKLICEINEDIGFVTEAREDGKKDYFIEGVFLQAELTNRNGRRYPMSVMEGAVNRYINESVNTRRGYGELNHPSSPTINLDRVAIMIKELRRDGNNYIGKAKVTETPMGDIVRGLINDGANLGVSSRGLGTLKPCDSGIMEVQSDFRLATAADVVADPSAPDAFVRGIMEGVEYWYDVAKGTWIEEKLDNVKTAMKKMNKSELEEKKLKMFEQYVNYIAKLR
jgi:hypothetical protein